MENFNNEKVNNFQYKKQQSIYFIYSQIKNNILQIQFKPKNENFNINELNLKYNQKNIINAKNENIINTIFEISFSLQKSLLKFYLEMNTIDKNRFISQEEYSIKKDKDLFIFNLEFKGYENYLLYFNTSEKKQLSMKEQFEIFNNYLKEKINEKIEKVSIKEILINDTIAILNKNKKNFDFDLFLCLFREIYFCGTLKKLLSVFDMKKININNNIDFKQFENIFKILLKKPIFLLNNLEWNENIEKKFYDVSILFFKLFEQKFLEKLLFPDLNEIKKENEKNYLKKRSKMMKNTILKKNFQV